LVGQIHESIMMNSLCLDLDILYPSSFRAWAHQIKEMPEGYDAFKNNIDPVIGVPPARYTTTLDHTQLRKISRAFSNVREAAGNEIEIAVHCHNEFDTPSAIAVAKAVEPMDPLFLEDPLNVSYSEGWLALKRASRI